MNNHIPFEPRYWQADPNSKKTERVMVTDMAGGLTEVFCLGNWYKDYMQINSPPMLLEKNTDYTFTFWLNGGENDRYQEVCKFMVALDGDTENPITYRLNRHYIKPERYNNGWYRYEIPFNTGDSEAEKVQTILQFGAMDAHCAVMPDKQEFEQLPPQDLPDAKIPQRHNIVFADGYPRDSHWSHLVFGGDNANQNRRGGFDQERLSALMAMGFNFETLLNYIDEDSSVELIKEMLGL